MVKVVVPQPDVVGSVPGTVNAHFGRTTLSVLVWAIAIEHLKVVDTASAVLNLYASKLSAKSDSVGTTVADDVVTAASGKLSPAAAIVPETVQAASSAVCATKPVLIVAASVVIVHSSLIFIVPAIVNLIAASFCPEFETAVVNVALLHFPAATVGAVLPVRIAPGIL